MDANLINIINSSKLSLNFSGELTLYTITSLQKKLQTISFTDIKTIVLDLDSVSYLDTAAAIFIVKLEEEHNNKSIETTIICSSEKLLSTLELVKMQKIITNLETRIEESKNTFSNNSFPKIKIY
ncbi:MAG TPA: anti-sigma factor antagonist, partial [Sulfurimonas sp.]|nr:anti-sigma factor antagonist [Sulfurimonas sp.]